MARGRKIFPFFSFFFTFKGILSTNSLDITFFSLHISRTIELSSAGMLNPQFQKSTLVPLRNHRIVKPLRSTCGNTEGGWSKGVTQCVL